MLSGPSCSAQNLIFRVGGGWASRYDNDTRVIGAFKIGLGYEIELNGMWSVEPGVLYFAKGWKHKDRVVTIYDEQGKPVYDADGNVRTGKMNVTSNADYIEVPVLFNYYIVLGQPHYLKLSAGPYAAYGAGGKTKTYGDTKQSGAARFFYDQPTFKLAGMHRFDAGIVAVVGYEFNRKVDAGINVDFGLVNINNERRKNFAVVLSLAYKI